MGLGLTVGLYADLDQNDPESADEAHQSFAAMAKAMANSGLVPHTEPKDCVTWSADGYGYTGLHALREVAGLVWRDLPIPMDHLLTGTDTPNAEALFSAAAAACAPERRQGLFERLLGEKRTPRPPLPPFAHLVLHSDADGFYVPVDFVQPLIPLPAPRGTELLWPLGSVQRLSAELDVLGRALALPDPLPDPDTLLETWLEGPAPGPITAPWQAQPIATHSLIILRQACDHSLRTGAAIAFV
ncbi:hypothetical protein EI545_09225 [Tabrizicola piscis]|uniref:Uncharacterized protein n=1 Tax=Tabrizicola piscis TaxID=2494374 RepID=A0A3S8U5P4_9RHOB|nr:hypothetical protein [Tabrizicola piscis]AZL59002.1 hypothetical protein EI545_09225 [Tabrizicola piscis]